MSSPHDVTALVPFSNASPSWGTSGDGFGRDAIMKFHVDIDAINTELGDTLTTNDTVTLWHIPIGTEIRKAFIYVEKAATATTCELEVGDGDTLGTATTQDGYMHIIALSAAGVVHGSETSGDDYAIVGGRLYTSASHLMLKFETAAPTGAIFDLYLLCTFIDF
jgi:hypothetical protein